MRQKARTVKSEVELLVITHILYSGDEDLQWPIYPSLHFLYSYIFVMKLFSHLTSLIDVYGFRNINLHDATD